MSDADKLLAEVNRRKKRASELGLPGALADFYDKAHHYPAWKNNYPSIVPKSLVNIREVDSDSIEFTYRGDQYTVTLKRSGSMPDGEPLGRIEMLINGRCVLEVCATCDLEISRWFPGDVTAFVEGPWVSLFKALATEAEKLYALQARAGFQDLEALRARFAIEASQGPKSWLARVVTCVWDWFKKLYK